MRIWQSDDWFALVLADVTPRFIGWQQALEGWAVKESQLVSSVKREGMLEGDVRALRAAVLDVLRARVINPVPDAVRLAIEGTNDPDILRRWLTRAATAGSIQEFAAAIVSSE
jgi:hypothetical protein